MTYTLPTNRWFSLSIAFLLLVSGGNAAAESIDSPKTVVCQQEPRCLAAVGIALETAKTNKKESLRQMLSAYVEFPDPRLCFNIGRLYQQTGDPRDAVIQFRQFLNSKAEQNPELIAKARSFLEQAEKDFQQPSPTIAAPQFVLPQTSGQGRSSGEAQQLTAPSTDGRQIYRSPRSPLHKQWWLWQLVGAVAVIGVTGSVAGAFANSGGNK